MQIFPHATLDAEVTPVRITSVIAAALPPGILVRVGRQAGLARGRCSAGLLYAACPFASRFAQEARSYALVTLAATFSTYALLRACRRPWLRRRWVLYGVTVVVLPVLNLLSLLLLSSHLAYVLASAPGAVRRRWATATGGGLLVASPLIVLAVGRAPRWTG